MQYAGENSISTHKILYNFDTVVILFASTHFFSSNAICQDGDRSCYSLYYHSAVSISVISPATKM